MTTPPGYVLIKSSELKQKNEKQLLESDSGNEHVRPQGEVDLKMSTQKQISSIANHSIKFVTLKSIPGKGIDGYSTGSNPKTYMLLFRGISNRTNSVAGVDTTTFSFDVSGGADFSSAAALFSECRVRAAKITLSPSLPSSGVVSRQVVGLQPNTGLTLTSEADVLQLQPLKFFTTGCTKQVSMKVNLGDSMRWASCSTPAPGPYAGLYGGFWFSSTGQASMSTVSVLYEVLVEFRGRT